MATPQRWILAGLWALAAATPLAAGQLLWTPGDDGPTLTLSLGDGNVKKTLDLPSGTGFLNLTLKTFLLDDPRITVNWKNDGVFWMRQGKKIPGNQATDRVALPPGRQINLEVTTFGGTPVASITLRRK